MRAGGNCLPDASNFPIVFPVRHHRGKLSRQFFRYPTSFPKCSWTASSMASGRTWRFGNRSSRQYSSTLSNRSSSFFRRVERATSPESPRRERSCVEGHRKPRVTPLRRNAFQCSIPRFRSTDELGKIADRPPDSKNGTDESEDRNRPDEDIDQGVSGLHPVVINFRLIVEDGVDFLSWEQPMGSRDPAGFAEDDVVLEFFTFFASRN